MQQQLTIDLTISAYVLYQNLRRPAGNQPNGVNQSS